MRMVNQTRSNILDKVQAVARFSAAPKLLHWQAALHIVVYDEYLRYHFSAGFE